MRSNIQKDCLKVNKEMVLGKDQSKQNLNIIKLFFKDNSLVRQHINSFNYFIETEIKKIVKVNNFIDSDIDQNFYLKFLNVRVAFPSINENMIESKLYPLECRNRDLTYASTIYVDIEYIKNKKLIIVKDLEIGKIPIMLRSNRCILTAENDTLAKECVYDNGGYFIIKGVEKVLQIQENLIKNRIVVDIGRNGFMASTVSYTIEHKSKTNIISKNDILYVQSNIFTEDVPAISVIKACGNLTDKEIVDIIGKDAYNFLSLSFNEYYTNSNFEEEQALLYLSQFIKLKPEENKVEATRTLLAEKLLSNVQIDTTLRNKGIHLCLMIKYYILVKLGKMKLTDKDYIGNKRYELAGQMISLLYEDTFKKFCFDFKKQIDKILSKRTRTSEFDALTFFNLLTGSITNTLNRAISSGNWNLKRFKMERSGVTHILTRYSYFCALGIMSKINSHFEKIRRVSGPRSLHISSWGMVCPSDTPEGEGCGLVKNLALLTEITTDSEVKPIEILLEKFGVQRIEFCIGSDLGDQSKYIVFLNGSVFGVISEPEILTKIFRSTRRKGKIDKYVSIYLNKTEKAVYVASDNGRMCRPLFIIDQEKLKKINFELLERKDNFIDNFAKRNRERNFKVIEQLGLLFTEKSLKGMTFNDLLKRGKVEYLDVKESNNCKIAFTLDDITCDTTHLEISEISILGNIVASVPFPDHNQSPRNTYQCAMGKQAIGHIATNVKKRFDNAILQLNYTQRPLAASKILDINKYNSIPSGLNAMVAVMSYSGYDIEDAIILNQGSVDRGFARVEVYKTIKIELKKFSNGANETIYSSAKSSGLVEVGQLVKQGDPLVVKISPEDKNIITIRHKGKPCYIDKVLLSKSEDENMIKIVTRETRVPVVGDKFSSRHGQKGVVGAKFPLSDMPFNEQGMVPDIIMNPHGFPSRMTVGKILELIGGKAGAIVGEYADATPFNDNEVEDFCNVLTKNGFSYSGKDIFTSGTTGEQYEAYIFYGPIFYQRLKHMVADKIHCRSRGPRAVLTRQPTEGRSNDGGLRLGEMERDCLIGYGAGSLLKERLMFASDVYKIFVCKKCGIIGYKNCCTICNTNEISPIEIPYAAKLLFQELMAMNVLPKIILKDK